TGKNIFVDFTGYTCVNCRAMESQVFSKPEVQGIFKDFVLARLYTDDGSPLNDSNQFMEESRFNTIALPFYAIITPDDKPIGTFPGYTRDHMSFINFLNKNKVGGKALTEK
ncbi:MAG TPA: thioredoxin family protein, partial [Candidatus Kapabacteria bacterium]